MISIKRFFKYSLHFVCFENVHNKRPKMKTEGWNWVFYPVPNLEVLWTASSFLQLHLTLVPTLGSTPWLYPFCLTQISHCAPWGQTRNCSSPNSRLEEAPDSEKGNYSFTHPLASCRWSWSWPLKVLSSLEYKGLTLCPWNYWVSIWLVLPSRLVSCILMWPYVFGSWVYGNWLGFPPTENWLHLTSPSRLN